MTAVTDTALHVAFHGDPDRVRGDAEFQCASSAVVHHDFRATDKDAGICGFEGGVEGSGEAAIEQ